MAKEITKQVGGAATDQLKQELRGLAGAVGERAVASVGDKVGGMADRLTEYAEQGGPGLKAALTGGSKLAEGKSPAKAALGAGFTGVKEKVKNAVSSIGGGGGGGKTKIKMINIVESIDIGVPVRVAYNQWTQFEDFPTYMKKVESVEQESDEKLNWRAQIFVSHRSWQATITEQIPDRRIVWRSEGEKGTVDGTVTFHELAPELTRLLLVMEYHPQGFFEKTANAWRPQGRRARLELKHFRRHVMTQTILHPEEVTGWRGEIRDGEVVRQHEDESDGDASGDGQVDRTGDEQDDDQSETGYGGDDSAEDDYDDASDHEGESDEDEPDEDEDREGEYAQRDDEDLEEEATEPRGDRAREPRERGRDRRPPPQRRRQPTGRGDRPRERAARG
jgi:uncharacterized membrane protein